MKILRDVNHNEVYHTSVHLWHIVLVVVMVRAKVNNLL